MEYKGENVLWEVRRNSIELLLLVVVQDGEISLTSSTRLINEVISNQHPQLKEYTCTLRINQRIACSSFLSLARTMP